MAYPRVSAHDLRGALDCELAVRPNRPARYQRGPCVTPALSRRAQQRRL